MRDRSLYISHRAALVSAALVALSVVFLGSMPLSAVNLGILMLFVYPFVLLLIATVAGFIPAFGAVAILMIGMWVTTRSLAAVALSGLYLLAPVSALMVCAFLKVPFWRTAGIILATYVGTVLLLYVLIQAMLGGNLAATGAQAAVEGMSVMPQRDYLLYLFMRSNILRLDTQAVGNVFIENGNDWRFSQEALTELFNQVRTRVDLWLRSVVPSLISSMSINLSVGGTAVALYYGRRHARRLDFKLEGPQQQLFEHTLPPVFSNWFIPKQYGNLLWVLAGFYLISRLGGNPTLFLAGGMMYNVFQAVYVLQGLSLVNSYQKARGTQPRMRGLTMVLLFLVAPPILMVLGLFDQLRDPRKLRKAEGEGNPEQDRRI